MTQYINKAAVVAEIERRRSIAAGWDISSTGINDAEFELWNNFLSFLDTLEVKEIELPNPRFPHLNNIVDKVFGTGNLESFEYEEAKQLVLLAKEELSKDLEVKEVDFGKIFDDEYSKFSNDVDAMDYGFPIDLADYRDFAKHFFELGLKAKNMDNE